MHLLSTILHPQEAEGSLPLGVVNWLFLMTPHRSANFKKTVLEEILCSQNLGMTLDES